MINLASEHLSKSVKYFRYYTKRGNKYFFTAIINSVFTHIIIQHNDNDTQMEVRGIDPTKKQEELLYQNCLRVLKERNKI